MHQASRHIHPLKDPTMVAAGGEQRDLSRLTPTAWPESCPSKYEEKIISIVCGNTHLHWALHDGVGREFMPQLFWRTPALNNDEIRTGDSCGVLERYLPHGGHALIFGAADAPADRENAAKASARRRIPALGVYVVSTNPQNEAGIEFLFRDISCRMHRLKASDFFSEEDGAYPGMGLDRLANLKAAVSFYNRPVLVIDGGTALTYTGLDANGKVMGGGIAAGLASKFRSMHDYTGALPLVTHEDVLKALKGATDTKIPLDLFALDTKQAMMAAALTETARLIWSAVKEFKARISGDNSVPNADEVDGNPHLTICMTGGDGDILAQLLESDHSSIVPVEHGTTNRREGIVIQKHKHLAHYGIAVLLEEVTKAAQKDQTEDDGIRAEIVGQRVAKKFRIRSEDTTYRGSVAAVTRGDSLEDDWFYIRYDDGDTEHLSIEGLYDALLLYKEIGEEPAIVSEQSEEKRTQANEMAQILMSKSAIVKKHSETPISERKGQSSRKRSAGPSKRAPGVKTAKISVSARKQDPLSYVGKRVAKYFGEDVFFGTVEKYIPPTSPNDEDLWHIHYDDEDQEDYDLKDLRKNLKIYEKHQDKDTKSKVTSVAEAAADVDGAAPAMAAPATADVATATTNGEN